MSNAKSPPTIIKKYANRRLYNTGTSVYVTLEDLAVMVKNGEEFVVQDAKTGEDITRSVLTQIIFELENTGSANLLPISFLRQLIRFYGDSLQSVLPGFLDMSLQNFTADQDKWRKNLSQAFGAPLEAFEEQVRNNMKMFEQTFSMFSPFAPKPSQNNGDDIDALREQMANLQKSLMISQNAEAWRFSSACSSEK